MPDGGRLAPDVVTEIGDPHGAGRLHLGRRARRDQAAERQHMHDIGHPHDESHVVFDHENRHTGVADLAEQPGEVFGLTGIEARGRLVEQQQPRSVGQSSSELDQSGLAGRQAIGPNVGHVSQAEPVDEFVGASRRRMVGIADAVGTRRRPGCSPRP